MSNTITSFNISYSDLPAVSEIRQFEIVGDNGAEFKLEVKDTTTGYYYNFITDVFQADKASLEKNIDNNRYNNSITFPNTTTIDVVNGAVSSGIKVVMDSVVATKMAVGDRVTGNAALDAIVVTVAALDPDDDNTSEFSLSEAIAILDNTVLSFSGDNQYDISLTAKPGTKHAPHKEVRFGDDTVDLNNSTGSSSLLIQKVIYKYYDSVLTINGYPPTGGISGANTSAILQVKRGKSKNKIAFSFDFTAATTAAFRILRQPTPDDLLSFVIPTVGSAPEILPGENQYPTRSAAFTGDDINGAITSGSVVRMDNTDLSAVIKVGDKITSPVTTDTVNGARDASAVAVTMDSAVATKMAVGDKVTGNAALDAGIFTVASLDSTNVFSISSAVAIADGVTLSFSSKINRSLTTVTVVETSGTATDFTMSQAIQFRDNAPLTFFNQMNYRWPIDNHAGKLKAGMIVIPDANVTAETLVSDYEDSITIFENTEKEEKIIKNKKGALNIVNKKPTVVKGLTTVQSGDVIFNKQQALALAGDLLKVGGYGEADILRVYDWDVRFTDLAISLNKTTTTTTEATSAHATIAVASKEGVINNVSRVSGIGIDPSAQNPLITSGGGATGAGDWVMQATQTLESGVTLTVENTGRVATVTGNIEVLRPGAGAPTLRFDVEKLLSTSA